MVSRRSLFNLICAALIRGSLVRSLRAKDKPRLLRKDSFFGLHFDLHPNVSDRILGRDLTPEMAAHLLNEVKPDFIQYDCKGAPGYLAYPSKVGISAPGIIKDSLPIWRRATADRGIALYIHFCGLLDSVTCERHPEWASMSADGKRSADEVSTFSPYEGKLMIPLLEEASAKYEIDGAWVDAECWTLAPDYSPEAVRGFRAATGLESAPKNANEKGWLQFLEYNREQFRKHLRRYVAELHRARPHFQIASNWMYSTFAPERPDIPVDFLSGDLAPVANARLEARYLAATSKPWDLISWSMRTAGDKTAAELQREAAGVIAQGGAYAVYHMPTRAGWLDDRQISLMSEVARFCRARQEWSHMSETVPQIGLLFSKNSLYSTGNRVFGPWLAAADPAAGMLDALLDNGYSVDIIPDWKLAIAMARYHLLIVPDWPDIGAKARRLVSEHVARGGKALIAGARNTELFSTGAGLRIAGAAVDGKPYVFDEDVSTPFPGLWQPLEARDADVLEWRYPSPDSRQGREPAATLRQAGKGSVALIHGPFGACYANGRAAGLRAFLRRIVDRVFQPMLEATSPQPLELVLRRKNGELVAHMLADGPVQVNLRTSRRPRQVMLEPGSRVVKGSYDRGIWSAAIDRPEMHSMLRFS